MASESSSSPKTLQPEGLPDNARRNQVAGIANPGPAGWLCVIIGLALAAGLRIFVLAEPLWLDELHTAWVVDTSLDQVSQRAAAGNQAPLFFWLTWIVTQAIGLSAVSLRLLSLASSLLLIVLSAQFVFKWTGSLAALMCVVLLFAVDPTMVFYGTEARPYALLQLVGFVQIVVFWTTWQDPSRNTSATRAWTHVVLLSVCSATLLYLHYTAALLLAAETVWVLVALCVTPRQKRAVLDTFSKLLAWCALTALLCGPMFGSIGVVFERKDQWVRISSTAGLLNELLPTIIISIGLPIASAMLLSLIGQLADQDRKTNRVQMLCLLVSCALVPLIIACFADQLGLLALAHSRYVVISLMAMFVFAAILIGSIKSSAGQWLVAALVFVSSCWVNPLAESLVKTGQLIPFRRECWEPPIRQINELDEKSNSPVFLIANLLEDREAEINQDAEFQDYLKFPVNGIFKIKNARRVIPLQSAADNPFSKSQIELIKGQGSAWILMRATRQQVQQVLSSLQNEFGLQLDCEYFASPDSDVILIRLHVSDRGIQQ